MKDQEGLWHTSGVSRLAGKSVGYPVVLVYWVVEVYLCSLFESACSGESGQERGCRTSHADAQREPIDSWIDFLLVRLHNTGQEKKRVPRSGRAIHNSGAMPKTELSL